MNNCNVIVIKMIMRKIPVSKIMEGSVADIVENTLKSDPKNAYTIMGLMVEKFGIKEAAIDGKSFNQWNHGDPTLYTKIRLSLEKMVRESKVEKQKVGRAMAYWWVENK